MIQRCPLCGADILEDYEAETLYCLQCSWWVKIKDLEELTMKVKDYR